MKEPFDERRYQAAILESLGRQPLCDGRRDGRARTSYPDERPARQGCARCLLVLHRDRQPRSEEHTSELQSLMRISYAVFCLKKKKTKSTTTIQHKSQQKHT